MIDGPAEHRLAADARGWLESPSASTVIEDCLIVSGWAFGTTSSIAGISATVSGARHPLRHGLRREDVADVYRGVSNAVRSGFSGYIELGGRPEGSVSLELWATFDDGRTALIFKRRLTAATASRGSSALALVKAGVAHAGALVVRTFRSALCASVVVRTFRSALCASVVVRTFRSALFGRATTAKSIPSRDSDVLTTFLASGSRLALDTPSAPSVSVIVVVWNQAELTLKCLRALAEQTDVPMEVIVVDNRSTDETGEVLSRVHGLVIVKNDSNLGFTVAANLGARSARGEFLLFLNNDAEVAPGCIMQLVRAARRADSIGAVGGKLVFPDGRLQEAGSIIWSDGSCAAYGRGADPASPEHNFERRVDFCSAALLLTPRAVFAGLGGFEECYRPAYYEDADYCAKLWTGGWSVVYQPKAVAVHREFGSAASPGAAVALQRERRGIFVGRHERWLESQRPRTDGTLVARSHPHGQPAVIVVDDVLPHPRMGSGFPRAAALLRSLIELGFLITVYTTREETPASESVDDFPSVEVVPGSPAGMRAFFESRSGSHGNHQAVIVSRPHNMRYVKAAMGSNLARLGVPCIYDAEAIYALRDIERDHLARQLNPESAPHQLDERSLIDAETSLTRGCAAVMTVSAREQELFSFGASPDVHVLGHSVESDPTPNAFQSRTTLLFIGAFGAESPNEDTVHFLCRDILPVLRAGGCDAPLVVAGARLPERLREAGHQGVSWHSDVGDLTPFYDEARVFVAPTRYSAGIPLKIVDAAARGVPIVCASRLAQQLGWTHGTELLTAGTPQEFARAISSLYSDPELWVRLRKAALARVAKEHSPDVFRGALQRVLSRVLSQPVRSAERSPAAASQNAHDVRV